MPDTTSGVVQMFEPRVGNLERAFASVSATMAGLASTLLAIDGKLDDVVRRIEDKLKEHADRSSEIRREVETIRLERAHEGGRSEVIKEIKTQWVTPWLSRGLGLLVFAGVIAFVTHYAVGGRVAQASAPTAAQITEAVKAALAEDRGGP